MNLSEMKQILAGSDIQLTKSLGQNFLHDGNQLRRIAAAAELAETDAVLEIGPGLGPLTGLLLEHGGKVLAIEKDARLVQVLEKRFAPRLRSSERFELRHADALDYLRGRPDLRDWKVVSNLPYSVASPILVELAQNPQRPSLIVVTLQLEVAARILASHGEAEYGLLSLLMQLAYERGAQFRIPAACFFPPPEVDSACIVLRRRAQPLLDEAARAPFTKIVKRAFSQRRKMMLKLLKQDWPAPALATAFADLGLSPQVRGEQVALEQFVALTRVLSPPAGYAGAGETFDVVNEQDEVVGQNSRREVHRLGLMHRAVHILVYNRRGEIFLQKRSMKKDRQPGLWDSSAAGHLNAGEDYDACAVREVREEIGLRLERAPQRAFKLPAAPETGMEHVWVYRCEAEGPFALDAEEIERGEWFAPEQVTSWMQESPGDFASAFRKIWTTSHSAEACPEGTIRK